MLRQRNPLIREAIRIGENAVSCGNNFLLPKDSVAGFVEPLESIAFVHASFHYGPYDPSSTHKRD